MFIAGRQLFAPNIETHNSFLPHLEIPRDDGTVRRARDEVAAAAAAARAFVVVARGRLGDPGDGVAVFAVVRRDAVKEVKLLVALLLLRRLGELEVVQGPVVASNQHLKHGKVGCRDDLGTEEST